MPGSGARKRNEILAMQCAKLASQGWSHRNIAKIVGKRPEQVKDLILKGERVMQVQPKEGGRVMDDIKAPDVSTVPTGDLVGLMHICIQSDDPTNWLFAKACRDEIARRKPDVSTSKPCNWDQDSEGIWDTSCGNKYVVNEGLPNENGMRFCCYCGRSLAESPYTDDALK